MKLFLFAFTLGVAVSGLFFMRVSHLDQMPEGMQSLMISGIDAYRGVLVWLRDDLLRSLWTPSGAEIRSVVAGAVFCFAIWWTLVFLRGIPGFFRDLGAFFPLGK